MLYLCSERSKIDLLIKCGFFFCSCVLDGKHNLIVSCIFALCGSIINFGFWVWGSLEIQLGLVICQFALSWRMLNQLVGLVHCWCYLWLCSEWQRGLLSTVKSKWLIFQTTGWWFVGRLLPLQVPILLTCFWLFKKSCEYLLSLHMVLLFLLTSLLLCFRDLIHFYCFLFNFYRDSSFLSSRDF